MKSRGLETAECAAGLRALACAVWRHCDAISQNIESHHRVHVAMQLSRTVAQVPRENLLVWVYGPFGLQK